VANNPTRNYIILEMTSDEIKSYLPSLSPVNLLRSVRAVLCLHDISYQVSRSCGVSVNYV